MVGSSVKVNMSISKLNSNANIYKNVSAFNSQFNTQIVKNTPLNGSMVNRIHNIKPGCGSCGK